MDVAREEFQREAFREILLFLAKSENVLRDSAGRAKIYLKLESLYHAPKGEEEFRHFYSDIFAILILIKQDNKPGSGIEVLGQNLLVLRKGYRPMNRDKNGDSINIESHLKKLYDHVSLDIARMNYSDGEDWKLSQEENISKLREQVNFAMSEAVATQTELKRQEDDLKSVQKEYVAILGIFASVVLTFTAGIAFSTSVLQNLHEVSIYRIACAILLIGIVLVNVLYGLFHYVDRLVNKPDSRKIKPLVCANAVLLGLLVIVGISWCCGCVEKRNSRVDNVITSIEQSIAVDDTVVTEGVVSSAKD